MPAMLLALRHPFRPPDPQLAQLALVRYPLAPFFFRLKNGKTGGAGRISAISASALPPAREIFGSLAGLPEKIRKLRYPTSACGPPSRSLSGPQLLLSKDQAARRRLRSSISTPIAWATDGRLRCV